MNGDAVKLWEPSDARREAANLTAFMATVNGRYGAAAHDYDSLYDWSVAYPEDFWEAIWDELGMVGDKGSVRLADAAAMPGAKFFPEGRVNFAENLMRGIRSQPAAADAMVFWGEDKVKRRVSWSDLQDQVARLAAALKSDGVGPGDRVAAFMPNLPETIIAMLAATSLGAVWSSCSPDFGVQGVMERFGQIEPKVLIAVEGYFYNGKTLDIRDKVVAVAGQLPSLKRVAVVSYAADRPDISDIPHAIHFSDYLGDGPAPALAFTRMPFNDPLYIMFSSGTTGVPKCIVHGIGGTLLQHLKEHKLQSDVKPGDRVFYFTTCGWMMWNWLVSGLAAEATLLLYDGSPFYPDGNILFDYAQADRMTLFGTSAKYIDALKKGGLSPKNTHDLSTLRTMTSTGSPLVPEGFDYVYQNIKSDIQLASISGGTDIVSCFVLGNPIGPVWKGEIQKRGLGLAVEVWNDDGKPVVGEKGELVCTKPFPCMPIYFWGDADGAKFRAAYFEAWPGVWCHGDYVELTEHGGMIIYGRSDAVLNPGGVRIGTAEIYRQVEQMDEVLEALVIGQDWEDDVRVVLFVRLADGVALDEDLTKKIKTRIRTGCTPRHVPAKVLAVTDIPRTKSGKIVELAVRNVVHGRPVKNVEALANAEALEEYKNRTELEE
ncbi:MAG: acetoacetate--CoA ligase [Alphaproteobacteria bacterium]|nr:acetoacetate--CoA ligase [Alphaproteobacteria bacterium]